MRKNLLVLLFWVIASGAFAQNTKATSNIVCESSLGAARNQHTSAMGQKTNLWYDKDIDVLSFVYAIYDLFDTLSIGYSYSLDHGATWTLDTLYHAPSAIYYGRFPQGAIYNPPGNTNPSNAYETCFGSTSDAGLWNAHYEGTSALGSGSWQQTLYPFTTYPHTFVPQGGTIVKNTGTTWWCAAGNSLIDTVYNDTIVLAKGTFGGGNFNYAYTLLPVPVCTDNNGRKMFRNQAIIFDDSGQNGYLVLIANDWACVNQDSAMGLIVFNTSDGGITWMRMMDPPLLIAGSLLPNNTGYYAAATQLDLAMDMSGKLHIGLPIVPFTPGNEIQQIYPWGSWGLFDISPSGLSYDFCLISLPQRFYGDFGIQGLGSVLHEENRLQLSRNWDGSKLFYTWFDTDTAIFGSIDNVFPDMHSVGYDLQTNLYSDEINFTEFTGIASDGFCLFGNVSYYTINDGVNENIPVVTDLMNVIPDEPINFYYIGCAAVDNYNNTGNCVYYNGIDSPGGNHPLLSDCTIYPNPFSGKTKIDVAVAKNVSVTIKISNAIGQQFASFNFENLNPGKNTLTLDGSMLSKGLYYCTVKAGIESITRIMSVE